MDNQAFESTEVIGKDQVYVMTHDSFVHFIIWHNQNHEKIRETLFTFLTSFILTEKNSQKNPKL